MLPRLSRTFYNISLKRHTYLTTSVVTNFTSSNKSFVRRHIGPRENEIQAMLDTCGVSSMKNLIEKTIPKQIHFTEPLIIPQPLTEAELLALVREIGNTNNI